MDDPSEKQSDCARIHQLGDMLSDAYDRIEKLENDLANSRRLTDEYAKIANSAVISNRELLSRLTIEIEENNVIKKRLRAIDSRTNKPSAESQPGVANHQAKKKRKVITEVHIKE